MFSSSGVVSTAVCYHNCEKRSYTMNTFYMVQGCRNYKVTLVISTFRPDPSGGSQGSNKGQILFFSETCRVWYQINQKITLNKDTVLIILLYVIRRCRNWKVTFRSDPPGGSRRGQIKVKFQFFQKLVKFGIKLIRKLC